jgi:hypothetical protein
MHWEQLVSEGGTYILDDIHPTLQLSFEISPHFLRSVASNVISVKPYLVEV